MKVLAITNLFPNCKEPGRGIFNRQQFGELAKLCEIRVVAPLPWRPRFWPSFHHDVPFEDVVAGLRVVYPRYLVTPGVGRRFYGRWMFQAIGPLIQKIRRDFQFDLIFATWGYPDCYAASLISREMRIPLVTRVHGTDINEGAKHAFRRDLMKQAFDQANSVVTNSQGLKAGVAGMGVSPEKIAVIVNGVDRTLFYPRDKVTCRTELRWNPQQTHVMFIGNLVNVKGITYLVRALKRLSAKVVLHIVGSGPLEASLKTEVARLDLSERVTFHGRQPHSELPKWLSGADALCLPSLNEGCPNVVLESLACGTPVAASRVGGIPDLIDTPGKGRLFEPKNPEATAQSLQEIFEQNSKGIRPDFQPLSWEQNARQLFEIFTKAIS